MPRKFNFPNMKLYDGTTAPDDHIAQYKQRMFTTAIPRELKEACMCKGFGSSLIGPALQWYTNLSNNSIWSFTQLTYTFVEQFAGSRKPKRDSQHLNTIRQGSRESLREYISRFNKENVSISNPNIGIVINTFRNRLHYGSDLCKELTKFPCKNFKDVLAKAWAQISWDEDEQYKILIGLPIKTNWEFHKFWNRNDNRSFRTRRIFERNHDSYTNGNHRIESRWDMRESRKPYERRDRAQERPRLPENNLSIEPTELVWVLKGMGETAK